MTDQVVDSPEGWVNEHIQRYVATGGEDGHEWRPGVPTLLLTTTGRKSGLRRRTALIYARDGEDHVVVASAGGRALGKCLPLAASWLLGAVLAAAAAPPLSEPLTPHVELLQEFGIAPTEEGIGAFLRELHPNQQTQELVTRLVAQLGADDYFQREAAMKQLLRMPQAPLGALRQGEVVPVIEKSDDYVRVEDSSGARGWAHRDDVWPLDHRPEP